MRDEKEIQKTIKDLEASKEKQLRIAVDPYYNDRESLVALSIAKSANTQIQTLKWVLENTNK